MLLFGKPIGAIHETHRMLIYTHIYTYFLLIVTFIHSSVTGEAELRLDVPDSITTWVTRAIGLSAEKGLGLAQTAELRTFKPFFIDFTLPYSVVRGEQTKVPLTVYNYLPTCAEVCVREHVFLHRSC